MEKIKEYFNFEVSHSCFSFSYRCRYSHFPSIIDRYVNSLLMVLLSSAAGQISPAGCVGRTDCDNSY